MTGDPNTHPLRLRKRHGEGRKPALGEQDGARLVHQQSLRNAVAAALIVLLIFCMAWILLSALTGRVFPWMTVVLGWATGVVVRYAGRGVDWYFPALAAIMVVAGSVVSNVVLAASTTAAEFGTGTLEILQAVTTMTWPVFFDEVWNIADGFYAMLAAGLAAFLAPRRLTREQRYALRLWRQRRA